MIRVRCYPKLALLDGNDPITTHDPRYAVFGAAHMLLVPQLIPYPRTAVIMIILPEHPFYLNEQLIVINPVPTL